MVGGDSFPNPSSAVVTRRSKKKQNPVRQHVAAVWPAVYNSV